MGLTYTPRRAMCPKGKKFTVPLKKMHFFVSEVFDYTLDKVYNK